MYSMLDYAAIVPHSPLLSSRISNKQIIPGKATTIFASMAKQIEEKGIKHIVSIGSYPRYDRKYFSCYIADEYTISFAEFGDLMTQSTVKVWQQGFHQLREQSLKQPIELLSQGNLDYTHGIPLIQLASLLPANYPVDFFAINASLGASQQALESFGKQVKASLDALDEPYAVICSGDLYVTTDQAQAKFIHAENKLIKLQLEKQLEFTESETLNAEATIKSPTLSYTLPILKGLLNDKVVSTNELLFESVIQTSFYFAEVIL